MGWRTPTPSLTNVSDEEIILELRSQGAIGVRRLRPKNVKTNANIRLTFFGKTPPTEIRAGFQDIKIKPWIRSPMLHCAGIAPGTGTRPSAAAQRSQSASSALESTLLQTAPASTGVTPIAAESTRHGSAAVRCSRSTSTTSRNASDNLRSTLPTPRPQLKLRQKKRSKAALKPVQHRAGQQSRRPNRRRWWPHRKHRRTSPASHRRLNSGTGDGPRYGLDSRQPTRQKKTAELQADHQCRLLLPSHAGGRPGEEKEKPNSTTNRKKTATPSPKSTKANQQWTSIMTHIALVATGRST